MAITTSIILRYCWVCDNSSVENVGLHQHHIVPQSYGGQHGPTVTICGTHHTFIHALALRQKQFWFSELLKFPESEREKLAYLAGVIARAKAAFAYTDKPMLISTKLDLSRSNKLRDIKRIKGLSSIDQALAVAIDVAYASLTPLMNTGHSNAKERTRDIK